MSSSALLQTTPLHAEHVRLGAKMIDFGGWDMPVQYTSIMDEHQTVRTAVGVFDISHMGQFFVRGEPATAWLNRMLTNNVDRLAVGQGQYTLMLNEQGGVIDDLILYRICDHDWLLVVNASKVEEDFAWLSQHVVTGVILENQSAEYAGLAVQGPKAGAWFSAFAQGSSVAPTRNHIVRLEVNGLPVFIARTGYTGEDGFELFCAAERAVDLFEKVLAAGAALDLRPCGLGARDTLRLEMCYPLNGNDLSPTHTPLEAGLGFFVDLTKPEFIGRAVLAEQKSQGLSRRLVAFKMTGAAPPPRSHYGVWSGETHLGETSSGGLSPTLKTGIGLAYLPIAQVAPGTPIEIDVRGRRFPAVVAKKPLHRAGTAG